ncbi:MAG: hypothetical protein HY548_07610 [Elusimicrobia bacterium]|nr:hypothetical protein [Elusimicrobiota bacterium]
MNGASRPFRFFTRLTLTVATGQKAATPVQLLDGLKYQPDSVIYHHTHRFLWQHQHLVPEPPNDFAHWVTHVLQEERLGEKLAAVDTVRFSSLGDLRRSLAGAVEDHLKESARSRAAAEGKEFHFLRAVKFSVPTPHSARTLDEFADGLKKVSISSLYLHVFEARLRNPGGENDFSLWLDQLGLKGLAEAVAALDPYTQTLEGLRRDILRFIAEVK